MKKKYARLVPVPKVEKDGYNHDRFISGLVMHQLIHLSAVEQCLPEEHRSGINISDLHTEREAADYIRRITVKIHQLRSKKRKRAKRGSAALRTAKKGSARPRKPRATGKRK